MSEETPNNELAEWVNSLRNLIDAIEISKFDNVPSGVIMVEYVSSWTKFTEVATKIGLGVADLEKDKNYHSVVMKSGLHKLIVITDDFSVIPHPSQKPEAA